MAWIEPALAMSKMVVSFYKASGQADPERLVPRLWNNSLSILEQMSDKTSVYTCRRLSVQDRNVLGF